MVKGIETNAKCTGSLKMGEQIVTSFDDHTLGIYRAEMLELENTIQLNSVAKCMTSIDTNTFVCGTDENKLLLIDKRTSSISMTIPTT